MEAGTPPNDQTPLARHERWRLQYRQKPYLTEASEAALAQRLKDVMNNMTTLTPEGKIGLLPIRPDGVRWMILFTHVLEEYESRGGILPIPSDTPFPQATAPDLPQAVVALKKLKMPKPGQTLIKLGKRVHMQKLYENGRIRIAPAGSYSDPSLNRAIKDDELKFDRTMPGSEVTITLMDQETDEPKKDVKPIGEGTKTTSLATNYYVYCMTHTMSYRLFDDFEADSCVIIRDPAAFCALLQEAVQAKLPDWIDWNQSVEYIDPYLHPKKDIDLIFSKHFRF